MSYVTYFGGCGCCVIQFLKKSSCSCLVMEVNSWDAAGEVRCGVFMRWVWLQFWMCSKMLPFVIMYLAAVRMFVVRFSPKVVVSMLVILRLSKSFSMR